MLTLRRLPRARVAVPAAIGSLESVAALALAHIAAGGTSPDPVWLLAFGVLGYAASVVVLRERASIRVVLPVLAAGQVFGHAWLVALAPGVHAAHATHAHDAGAFLGLSPAMLGAHAVAAVVTATMWVLRRRAVEVVLCWAEPLAPALVELRRTASSGWLAAPMLQHLRSVAPIRGPPVLLAPTA